MQSKTALNYFLSLSYGLGKDLPGMGMGYGPRMTPTATNKLLMTYFERVYSFKCRSSNDCFWEKENYELKTARSWHVMLSVPSPLVENC